MGEIERLLDEFPGDWSPSAIALLVTAAALGVFLVFAGIALMVWASNA